MFQEVRQLIEVEQKYRKKKYPLKKKLRLKANIMTYGVLALACRSKESAEKLLTEMKADQLKYVCTSEVHNLFFNGTCSVKKKIKKHTSL